MMPILRFFPRQLLDFLLTRGAAMFLVGMVLILPVLVAGHQARGEADFDAAAALIPPLLNAGPFLIMVAAYGLTGQDFRLGYYRFLFVRPLSPAAYYVSSFVVALVGFLITLVALSGVFALAVEPVWLGRALLDAIVFFVMLGGLICAFSRFTRLDWLLALFVIILGDLIRQLYPREESLFGAVFHVILPPDAPDRFFGAEIAWGPVAWALGYGLGAFALGLVALRVVPMGTQR